jgi:hypothetical protein
MRAVIRFIRDGSVVLGYPVSFVAHGSHIIIRLDLEEHAGRMCLMIVRYARSGSGRRNSAYARLRRRLTTERCQSLVQTPLTWLPHGVLVHDQAEWATLIEWDVHLHRCGVDAHGTAKLLPSVEVPLHTRKRRQDPVRDEVYKEAW